MQAASWHRRILLPLRWAEYPVPTRWRDAIPVREAGWEEVRDEDRASSREFAWNEGGERRPPMAGMERRGYGGGGGSRAVGAGTGCTAPAAARTTAAPP